MTWAAAVAFYAMLATVPFMGIVLVGVVLRLPDVTHVGSSTIGLGNLTLNQLEITLKSIFPNEAFVVVRNQIARIQKEPPFGMISVGTLVSLWSASNLFLVVIDALNRTHGVKETRSYVKLRLTAMWMTLLQAACLFGSLVAIVAWPQILDILGLKTHEVLAWLISVVHWLIVVALVFFSFAMTFQIGPNTHDRWGWITPGTVVGTLAFLTFCYFFRLYVQYSRAYSALGALGGVMALLFWFWCVALVLLAAAEMDRTIEAGLTTGGADGAPRD